VRQVRSETLPQPITPVLIFRPGAPDAAVTTAPAAAVFKKVLRGIESKDPMAHLWRILTDIVCGNRFPQPLAE
jgi:hypothetical protein